jgi:hypothetical protein
MAIRKIKPVNWYAPTEKEERIPFEKREAFPGKWNAIDKAMRVEGDYTANKEAMNEVPSKIKVRKRLSYVLNLKK